MFLISEEAPFVHILLTVEKLERTNGTIRGGIGKKEGCCNLNLAGFRTYLLSFLFFLGMRPNVSHVSASMHGGDMRARARARACVMCDVGGSGVGGRYVSCRLLIPPWFLLPSPATIATLA